MPKHARREMGYRVFGVDPGPTHSAFVKFDGAEVLEYGWIPNAEMERMLAAYLFVDDTVLAVEVVAGMGMAVGDDVFDTQFWAGRFTAIWRGRWYTAKRVQIKALICGTPGSNDANVRQALIDRFGGDEKAIGGKRCPICSGKGRRGRLQIKCDACGGSGWRFPRGPLHGISRDCWSALAVCVAFIESKGLKWRTGEARP